MSAHVLTVTPNPSIDLLFEAGALVWDDANRLDMPRRRAGGQGINVTRVADELGGRTTAVALLGGAVGAEVASLLEADGIDVHVIDAPAETRVFVAVRERSTGRSLLLNPRGPACGSQEEERLLAEVARVAERGGWVVSSGSVPPGFSQDFHARVRDTGCAAGARVVVDCDGPALRSAAPGCTLLVPNVHEAERLLERRIRGVREAAAAVRALLEFGARHAAITLGVAGAVLAAAGDATVWHAQAPEGPAGASAVGAGDAFLAGLLLRLDQTTAADAVRYAVAAGTAVLHGTGDRLLERETVELLVSRVNVEKAG